MDSQILITISISASFVIVIWSIALTYLYLRQQQFFKNFTAGVTKKDLKTVLKNIATSLNTIGDEINVLHGQTKSIQKADEKHLQHVGFLRYNPFSDTGGDQSFCICLLDDQHNGFVITSLHSREQTRLYSKPIKNGTAEGYELSKEEEQALNIALKKRL